MLRRALAHDAPGLARVHVRAWQAAYRGVMPEDYLDGLDVEQRTAWWRDRLSVPGAGLTVAVADGAVVGFAHAGPAREAATGDDGELYAINLDPSVWRQGIGTALLRAAEADLRTGGHRVAALWVATANPRARAFYERHGWRADGVTRTVAVGGLGGGSTVDVAETRYGVDLGGGSVGPPP